MWIYQWLDILSTAAEMFCLYMISGILLKEHRFHIPFCKYIPPIIIFILTYILTWFSELGAFKVPIIFILAFTVLQVSYKEPVYQCAVAAEMWFVCCAFLAEASIYLLSKFVFHNMPFIIIEGQSILRWEIYAAAIIVRIVSLIVICTVLKDFKYKVKAMDCLVLSAAFIVCFTILMLGSYNILNLNKAPDLLITMGMTVLTVTFLIVFLYSKNMLYLREQEQNDKMRIAQLNQQFAYYQDKLKDEERIRSIYHDMKNHLLVLEGSRGTDETRKMAQELRAQIADYESYVRTGNDFLDIIIRDKAQKSREKQIDFSAFIDFSGVDFLEPLDISTLFGNGIDNAMEACQKLPQEQRVILVKAGKARDFVSILIENTCPDEARADGSTTKSDKFLHGFGISNMKKAAEKYGGTCTAAQAKGLFTLKILLPLPAEKAVN